MRTLRHFGPPPKPRQPTAGLGYGPDLPLAELRITPACKCAVPPAVSALYLTLSTGVSKMRPKMMLYMLNMLHM